ncbi:MAG: FAD-dependent oxidoreductase [Planctomycetes bacterium]|nr:FAD-dependent oxidoreductase [Planctomycetota bacterium]
MFARTYDCLIVGAGPAGCRLALGLVEQGLEVLLLDHLRPTYSGPHESVIGWTSSGWFGAGRKAIEAALPQWDALRRGAIWGSEEVRWQNEFLLGGLIRRGEFDRRLRAQCVDAGVTLAAPATLAARRDDGTWVVRDSQCDHRVRARTVVVATGRARRSAPLPAPEVIGPPLLAVTVLGTPAGEDRGSAVIESVPDGWSWCTALPEGPASAVLMIEPALLAGGPSRAAIAGVLATCRGPAGRLRDWRVVCANDATPRCRPPHAALLALGDAAATVDPMASQGVEKALHMADSVAGLIAPAIANPDWLPQLCRGHAEREHQLARTCQLRAQDFYRAETRWAERPFWRARQAAAPSAPAPVVPTGPLRVAPNARPGMVVTVGHRTCRAQPGWNDERTGRGLSQIGGLPLTPLFGLFERPRSLAEAVAAAATVPELFVSSPAKVREALLLLCADGWLIPAGS